jgi:hypothetical protein
MNRTRIVLLGILAVLVAVWVSSATLPPPDPAAGPKSTTKTPKPAVSAATRQRQDVTSFSLNEAAERLRSHLNAAPRPESPERNPFEFVHAAAPKAAAATPAPSPLPVTEPVGPPPPPLLTLTGMAEQQKDQALERTAILSSNNQMFFAKIGDKVLARYEVTAIGADAIELRDAETGQTLRLGLR